MNRNNGYCQIVGATDVGCVRKANEDSLGWSETKNGLAAVVCDGMGGHVGGATASRIAVETILDMLDTIYYTDPRIAIGDAIDQANKAILRKAYEQPELNGMGSTCVLLLVRAGFVYIGSVGDSRIYLIRNRVIQQLTKDHSYVQMLVDMGHITPDQAEVHPRKNEITNALGIPQMKPATIQQEAITPEAGDCFLLCSDGLTGMLSDKEIRNVIGKQGELSTQERADLLVQKAKIAGGTDNITLQIVEFSVAPSTQKPLKKRKIVVLSTLVALTILLLATLFLVGQGQEHTPQQSQEITLAASRFTYNTEVLTLKEEGGQFNLYCNNRLVLRLDESFPKDSIENLQPYLQYESVGQGFRLMATGAVPNEQIQLTCKGKEWVLTIHIPIELEGATSHPIGSATAAPSPSAPIPLPPPIDFTPPIKKIEKTDTITQKNPIGPLEREESERAIMNPEVPRQKQQEADKSLPQDSIKSDSSATRKVTTPPHATATTTLEITPTIPTDSTTQHPPIPFAP